MGRIHHFARSAVALALLLTACNPDPGYPDEQVGYRFVNDGETSSGERGNVQITEVLWSGSVKQGEDGDFVYDPTDVFIELRNTGNLPVKITGWQFWKTGSEEVTWVVPSPRVPEGEDPESWEYVIGVGDYTLLAAKESGCFPEPDYVMPEMEFAYGEPFRFWFVDADERVIEMAGDQEMAPYAGGYDLVVSRSMERIELMFGGRGTDPHMWHHYTDATVTGMVPNQEQMLEACRERTHASPGNANSPDYSGAYSSGGFE